MTGREFRAHRLRLGLTQAALGKELEVTRETVSRWEGGQLRITRMTALALLQLVILNKARSGTKQDG